eukprot:763929_1
MDAQEVQDLSVSYEISQSVNSSSFTTMMSNDTSNAEMHENDYDEQTTTMSNDNDEQRHIISLTIDPSKEIRTIAEREATLKGKRTVIGMSQNLERFWAYFLAIFFGDSLAILLA